MFLYTDVELSEKEIFRKFYYNRIKINIILKNKFNQGGERFDTENYKTLMKEVEKNKDFCLWIKSINIVKMSMLPHPSVDSMYPLSKFNVIFL